MTRQSENGDNKLTSPAANRQSVEAAKPKTGKAAAGYTKTSTSKGTGGGFNQARKH